MSGSLSTFGPLIAGLTTTILCADFLVGFCCLRSVVLALGTGLLVNFGESKNYTNEI